MSEVLFKEVGETEGFRRNMGCEILIEREIERLKELNKIGELEISNRVYLATLERELIIIKNMGTTAISSTGMTISEWEKTLENSKVYVIDNDYIEELLRAKEKVDELKKFINI